MKATAIAAVVLACWLVTYGAQFAHLCSLGPSLTSERGIREDLGFSIVMAVLPPAWLVVPFITGFYYDGFAWTPNQCRKLKEQGRAGK